MNSEVNPYIKGGIVPTEKIIVGLKKERNVFSPLIYEGGSVGVYGDRSTGKTSLLRYIAEPPTEWKEKFFQNHLFIMFNCPDTVTPFTPAKFWLEVVRHLEGIAEGNLKEMCRTLLVRHEEGDELSQRDFHDILDVAAEEGKRLVLVLDDFDSYIRTDSEHLETTRAFLQGLRSLVTRYSNKANLVVSTRCSLEELCKPVSHLRFSPFSNGFTCYRLRMFREAEMAQLFQWIEKAGQEPFSPEEVRYIYYLSGCHPQLAQIVAAEIFDQRLEGGGVLDDLTPVGERFTVEACRVFEGLWDMTKDVERMLLMLIALQEQKGKVPDCHYDLSDVPTIFSKWERELIELVDRGLITRQEDPPAWTIFSPIFNWWVIKEIESAGPEQLNEYRRVWGNLLNQNQADKIGVVVDTVRENRDLIKDFAKAVIQMAGWTLPFVG